MDSKQLRGGYFVFNPGTPQEERYKNTVVADGADLMLKMIFQDAAPFAASFHLGLSNASYTYTEATLAAFEAEEPSGNGYARAALSRDDTDWEVSLINNIVRVQSKICQFTAAGTWSKQVSRAFLVDQTASKIIAVGGPSPSPRTVLVGQGPRVQYEYWLPG